jgi:hypothetical protein
MSEQRAAEARTEPTPAEAPDRTRPVHTVRLRNVRATIWANDTETGVRYNTTVSRIYKGPKDGEWRTSDSFGRDDLLLLSKVLDIAHTWISEQTQSTASLDSWATPSSPSTG